MTPWLYMGTLGLTWLRQVSFLLWLIQQNALSFKACYITADCCLIHSPHTEDIVLTLLVTALTHFHCNPCFPNQKRGSIHVHDSFVAGIGRQPFAKSRLSLYVSSVCGGLQSGRRAALHADKPGQGEAAVPVYAPIHHRYGNYYSVVCEADPHLASKTGSPGDTDYKTLQWRLSLLRAGLSFSPPVNWGGRWWWWWLTSIDEKSFSGRHLGPLLDLHLYTLNEDHACHVCIRSGEYIPFQFTSVHVFLSLF